MVTEKAPVSEDQKIQEMAKTMEFEDTTPAELRAPAPDAVAVTQTPPPAPVSAAPPETKPTVPAEPAKAGVNLSEIPEWRQAQSNYDKRIAAMEQRFKQQEEQYQVQIARTAVEASVEAHLKAQEENMARALNDPEQARAHVRSGQNVQAVRDYFGAKQELEVERRRNGQSQQLLEYAGRLYAADEYARKHSVAPEDRELLLTASTPEAMERLAQRLARQSANTKADAAKAEARVPAETAKTRLESGEQGAPPGRSFWELIDAAQDKSWSDMTPVERDAVKRVAMNDRVPQR